MPSRNLRMSSTLTLHCWLIRAQLRDTFSTLLPVMVSSSFTPSERATLTPGSIFTTRTRLSPRKLRISRVVPPSMLMLMGKWAYTRRILYWKPLVTPTMRFCTCETTVRREASCLRRPECRSTLSFFWPFSSIRYMSRVMCVNSRCRVPRGPFTRTCRPFTSTVTPSGMGSVRDTSNSFMAEWAYLKIEKRDGREARPGFGW
mmetsp:Transcript_21529/g.59651  ORF Transcript_21529/g.59651 Transcript_21529/m.59651 type:complete len:202 (-) Transcript_21529:9-614(-)